MRRLLPSLLLLSLFVAVSAVNADPSQSYGATITETRTTPLAKLLRRPSALEGRTLRIEGTVKDVCQGRGCWIELSDAKGRTFLAKSLDETVLVPKDIAGRRVVVQGVLTSKPAKGHVHEEGEESGHSCPAPTWVLDTRGVEVRAQR
jgi:hypothetical protein